MIEEWRDINGYEGKYQVSNKGRVKSVDREVNMIKIDKSSGLRKVKGQFISILKPTDLYKYYGVSLSDGRNNKRHFLHRLIAIAFIPNPNNKPCVNHKDGNKLNNDIDNLEWVTYGENLKHAIDKGLYPLHLSFRKNLTNNKKAIVCEFPDGNEKQYASLTEAGIDNNILVSSIANNIKGLSKYCGNKLKFKYA